MYEVLYGPVNCNSSLFSIRWSSETSVMKTSVSRFSGPQAAVIIDLGFSDKQLHGILKA